MDYTIKLVDATDEENADHIEYLHTVIFWKEAPKITPAEFEVGHWWLVYWGENVAPIGFAGLIKSSNYSHTGYLTRSGIMQGHRGHGLQRRLIRVRERKARKLGWGRMISDTTGNAHSANNLIKCGYLMFHPAVPWFLENTCYWTKDLCALS